jgi:hypothetical protein
LLPGELGQSANLHEFVANAGPNLVDFSGLGFGGVYHPNQNPPRPGVPVLYNPNNAQQNFESTTFGGFSALNAINGNFGSYVSSGLETATIKGPVGIALGPDVAEPGGILLTLYGLEATLYDLWLSTVDDEPTQDPNTLPYPPWL